MRKNRNQQNLITRKKDQLDIKFGIRTIKNRNLKKEPTIHQIITSIGQDQEIIDLINNTTKTAETTPKIEMAHTAEEIPRIVTKVTAEEIRKTVTTEVIQEMVTTNIKEATRQMSKITTKPKSNLTNITEPNQRTATTKDIKTSLTSRQTTTAT